MIKFDFNSYNNIHINNDDLSDTLIQFKQDNQMTGWYDLNIDTKRIKEYSDEIRSNADVFLVVGIGGSYLGAKAIISALQPYFSKNKPEIIFAGTDLSSSYLKELLDYLDNKEVYINIISKSGTTLETTINYDILMTYMKDKYSDFNKRIIITTNKNNGYLLEEVKKYSYPFFEVPDNIGGRFSVLSNVGLLPIAVAGCDIDALIKGANDMKNNLNDCYYYTCFRHTMYNLGRIVESFNVYEPKLYYFTEWLKQLFAETQGKNNKGILPVSTVNTRDLHSLGQYFQEGSPIIFSTTISVQSNNNLMIPSLNMTLDDINQKAILSVAEAHKEHTPTNIIYMDKIDEYNLGYLIFFFEMSAMLGSYLLDINYYDQPGVTKYKEILQKAINGE